MSEERIGVVQPNRETQGGVTDVLAGNEGRHTRGGLQLFYHLSSQVRRKELDLTDHSSTYELPGHLQCPYFFDAFSNVKLLNAIIGLFSIKIDRLLLCRFVKFGIEMDKSRLKEIIADVDREVIKAIATHLIEHELISDGVTLLILSGVDQNQCSSILQSVL